MKLYYIDDSIFRTSRYANELQRRFLSLLMKNRPCACFISSTHTKDAQIKRFKHSVTNEITFLESPALFDFNGIRGHLQTTFLALDQYPVLQTYHGSFICYDIQKHTFERIYIDMFPKYAIEEENHFFEKSLHFS